MNESTVKVIKAGRTITFSEIDSVSNELPVGHYSLNYDSKRGYYFLTTRKPFKLPTKIYSDPQQYVDRFLHTYRTRKQGMGVLLSGDKGTGKTLMAKMLANQCNMPVIRVTTGYTGQALTEFIEMLQVPCMFFVDEFEKLYAASPDRRSQEGSPSEYFLSLLDGTAINRHLWVLTSNSHDVGEYFAGRPGRIRYHKQFHGLDHEMIAEIINDNIKDQDLASSTMRMAASVTNMSLDALMCIIEEVNIHKEAPDKFMSYFNVTSDNSAVFSGELHVTQKTFPPEVWIDLDAQSLRHYASAYVRMVASSHADGDDDWYDTLNRAQQFADKETGVGLIHHKYGKSLQSFDMVYTASYLRPFEDMSEENCSVLAPYLRIAPEFAHLAGPTIPEFLHVNWDRDSIDSIEQDKGRIIVLNKKANQRLVLRQAKHKPRSYSLSYDGIG